MPEHATHPDLGAYAIGGLEPDEAAALEQHLAGCPRCRDELTELRATAALLGRAAPAFEVPAGLEERTMRALARATGPRRRAPNRLRVVAAGLAAAAVLVGGTVVATRALEPGPAGTLEVSGDLSSAADPSLTASATVRDTGLGRTITLRSDRLPVLPKGEFYELWFVGPGDAPGARNRISAGTFHPDAAGRTRVTLHAAVNPALYRVLSITAQTGGEDQEPGPEVVRLRS